MSLKNQAGRIFCTELSRKPSKPSGINMSGWIPRIFIHCGDLPTSIRLCLKHRPVRTRMAGGVGAGGENPRLPD